MDLYKLLEKKDDIESDIKYYRREKERLEIQTGLKATKIKDIITHSESNTTERALIELAQVSSDLDEAIKKYDSISQLVNDKYNIYKKRNNYEKQVYTEKKLFKWSNAKISTRHHGMSKSTIYRIVEKIESLGKSGKL